MQLDMLSNLRRLTTDFISYSDFLQNIAQFYWIITMKIAFSNQYWLWFVLEILMVLAGCNTSVSQDGRYDLNNSQKNQSVNNSSLISFNGGLPGDRCVSSPDRPPEITLDSSGKEARLPDFNRVCPYLPGLTWRPPWDNSGDPGKIWDADLSREHIYPSKSITT